MNRGDTTDRGPDFDLHSKWRWPPVAKCVATADDSGDAAETPKVDPREDGEMFERLKQLKQVMGLMQNARQHAEELRARCARETVVGSAGGDMIRVTMNLLGEVQRIEIDPVLRSSPDWDVLTDLLRVAINNAYSQIPERMLEVAGEAGPHSENAGDLDGMLNELVAGSGLASLFGGINMPVGTQAEPTAETTSMPERDDSSEAASSEDERHLCD
ncbi:MAG: hypothetical protein D6725_17505 [Planctomycetota bacterium]|nr:MAG: hypothetical protein D6725_17505 [Planctomycetota bacterium]